MSNEKPLQFIFGALLALSLLVLINGIPTPVESSSRLLSVYFFAIAIPLCAYSYIRFGRLESARSKLETGKTSPLLNVFNFVTVVLAPLTSVFGFAA